MLIQLRIRWNQFVEEAKEKSYREAVQRAVAKYIISDRVVVPVVNDFSKLKETTKTEATAGLELLIVNESNARLSADMHKTPSRKLKMVHNTQSGYYAYAVASQGEIIGDIWCVTPKTVKSEPIHHDLTWLDIKCGEHEAYMFDMYVVPDSRGKVVTSFLLAGALCHLKEKNVQRVYGFYEKNNLPALWTHRLFGYTELANRRVVRFLLYQKHAQLSANG